MATWMDRWNAYWFPKTTALSLSLCRIVVVGAQLLWFSDSLESHLNIIEKNQQFIDPQLLIWAITTIVPREVFFSPTGLTVLSWVTVVTGITALLGLFTRSSVFIFALANWIFIAHRYSYADIHHIEGLFSIFLMLLAFSPSGKHFSVDAFIYRRRNRSENNGGTAIEEVDTALWPLKLIHVLLALSYFSTGLTKLMYGGLGWMNGYTLQGIIFTDAIARKIPLGVWVAQQHTLCTFLSISTVLFELFFFVSLIVPWTLPYFLIGGILFHTGLYVTAGHDFFQHIVLLALLLVFLPQEQWKTWREKRTAPLSTLSYRPS